MDNITHTLVGLVVADGAVALRKRLKTPFTEAARPAAYLISALANNLPDSDLLYTSMSHDRVGYLLYHRGFTHTLVACLPLAIVAGCIAWFFNRRNWQKFTVSDLRWLGGLAVLGTFLHIGCDALNSYGVHPFWPFDNRWYYGDTLFIVEPTLWLSLLVPFFFRGRWPHRLATSWLAITLLLCFFSGYVPPSLAGVVTVYGLTLYALAWFKREYRTAMGLAIPLLLIAIFAAFSSLSRRQIAATVAKQFPSSRVEDIVLNPLPANVFCWLAISVERDTDRYIARRATVSPLPGVFSSEQCAALRQNLRAEDYGKVSGDSGANLTWLGELSTPVAELQKWARESCAFGRFLYFARVPEIRKIGSESVFSDLRFGWRGRANFTEMAVDSSEKCPPTPPPWIPPRAGLLDQIN